MATKSLKKPVRKTKTTSKSSKANVSKKTVQAKVQKKKTVVIKTKIPSLKQKLSNLRLWNYVAAGLHTVSAVLVVVLSAERSLPVSTSYLTTDSLASTAENLVLVPASRQLFDVNMSWLIAAFFVVSAIAHISVATWYRKRYEANLAKRINYARWIEYSFSASLMLIAIAMIAGVYDLSTLLLIAGSCAVMNLCGLAMELVNQGRSKVNWFTYLIGCKAAALPWIVFLLYVVGSARYGSAAPPAFVYFILGSIFLLFNSFALNMFFQYRRRGRFADYLYGEKTYIVLSLLAKSALAWQVFAGILRP